MEAGPIEILPGFILQPVTVSDLPEFAGYSYQDDVLIEEDEEEDRHGANGNGVSITGAAVSTGLSMQSSQQQPSSSSPASSREENATWLMNICEMHIAQSGSMLSTEQLVDDVLGIVAKSKIQPSPEEYLQSKLFELVGENGFEVMLTLMENINKLKDITPQDVKMRIEYPAGMDIVGEVEDDMAGMSLNQRKKLQKKIEKQEKIQAEQQQSMDWLAAAGFSAEYLERERMLGLQGGNARGDIDTWREGLAPEGTREYHEKKGLPAGAKKEFKNGYEEVFIPAPKRMEAPDQSNLIAIESLETWAQMAFQGTARLNRIQSAVFESAYHSGENMLVCAPTGAGKTNIAMLTFLQALKAHIIEGDLDKEGLKCIYIAPMKALAQEVVTKFKERLDPLGLVVKEYTGDMQLTKQEVEESQLLVSTPEKYDVITRKGGEGSLGTLVSLIIIDEVHLLADDRGAVIETIVARTQRYIESAQQMVRIVGLSATLPNYKDVATFLRVNPTSGMFFFGPEFRPVPLDQTFIGVTEANRNKAKDQMNKQAYRIMVKALERGKQVMIFVHSRKETSTTADAMRDLSTKEGTYNLLDNCQHEKYTLWKRQVDKSRSQEVQNLFNHGLGIHHAGMLRADRTMTEELFEQGLIKVLCCTATLAWGVNLPAHTVVIKGTEMYDAERGGFVDVSILDVLQIFGRAGRPQYDNQGHAVMITQHKSLNNYLNLIGQQAPIESGFIKALPDHMNAEIVNGTINNIKEAASWLSYTFLFVRMRKNPLQYGMAYDNEFFDDPQLMKKREELVKDAAVLLDRCMMIRYDPKSGNLAVTDLGRIASHYYIKHDTIEAFNTMLSSHLNDVEALHVLCSSAEFDQLKVRPEELQEIDQLKKNAVVRIVGPVEDTAGKVNALLQGYLSQQRVNSFTLQSDTNYVSQNAGRIARALFEICLKRGWSTMANHYLNVCKSIDRRVHVTQTPLRQFYYDELPRDTVRRIEDLQAKDPRVNLLNRILDMEGKEVGQLIHNQKLGGKVLSLVQKLPHLHIDAIPQPITRTIMRLVLNVTCDFEWADRYHGMAEPFWIWIEDGESEYIYHAEQFMLQKKQMTELHRLEFTIPLREPLPPQYYVKAVSDKWVGCTTTIAVSFQHLILPDRMPPHTNLLDVHPVPRSALRNPLYESLYKFSHFNPVQSQAFHALYHTDVNILVGAPTGSGKTIISELALLRLLQTRPGAKAIYVAPLKALARERLEDWQNKLGKKLGLNVLELTGDVTPDVGDLNHADLLIVTPEKWDSISRGWQKRDYVQRVELVIIDEIHLLGVDRGPVLEVIVSRMRFISCQTSYPIRFVGLSTALANPRDLADWLGIGHVGVYNFRPSVRPIPMSIHIQGFPGKHYCPRMATMNKPAYAAILEHSPTKPALIFVSSRRQTRLTALDLISYCASDDDPHRFLHMPQDEVAVIAETFRDTALKDTILFGVAIHHAGLDAHDRKIVEELFYSGKVQVLVCTSTLAWGVNLPCHLVIVKGTEFFDGKVGRYVDFPVTDVLQMIGRAGRPQFDDSGVACVFVHEPKKNFYRKFLHEPFPVESSLHNQLHEHINAEIVAGVLTSVQDCMEYLSWTYYFRRLVMNPSYYQLEDVSPEGVAAHLTSLLNGVIRDLVKHSCVRVREDDSFECTTMGKIASFYYLHYRTVGFFHKKISDLTTRGLQKQSDRIEELVRIISDAYEFAELPVRHNEDVLNGELADLLPWPVESGVYGSAHTKAFLLLQAHFTGTPLPIFDYVNDTKSVLDQAPRVVNALIDVVAEMGQLEFVLDLTRISQMIVQGMKDRTDEMLQLPGIGNAQVEMLRQRGVTKLRDVILMSPSALERLISSLQTHQPVRTDDEPDAETHAQYDDDVGNPQDKFAVKSRKSKGRGDRGKKDDSAGDIRHLARTVRDLPNFTIGARLRTVNESVGGEKVGAGKVLPNQQWVDIALGHTKGGDRGVARRDGKEADRGGRSGRNRGRGRGRGKTDADTDADDAASIATSTSDIGNPTTTGDQMICVPVDSDCELEFTIQRTHGNSRANVYSPKYHRPKQDSWWLLVGDASGELLALKRLGSIPREIKTVVVAAASPEAELESWSVHLVCDSLIGIDIHTSLTFQTTA